MNDDFSFSHDYSCEVLDWLPQDEHNVHYFTSRSDSLYVHGGLILRVIPFKGNGWVGIFKPGSSVKAVTGIFTHPDKSRVCVVVKGQGYIVDVVSPSQFDLVEAEPVEEVLPLPAHNKLLLADPCNVCAYGENGLLWISERLALDGLKLGAVENNSIEVHVFAWDEVKTVFLNLETGGIL